MEADHIRRLFRDLEAELLYVEQCGVLRIVRLNQNIRTKFVCHFGSPASFSWSLARLRLAFQPSAQLGDSLLRARRPKSQRSGSASPAQRGYVRPSHLYLGRGGPSRYISTRRSFLRGSSIPPAPARVHGRLEKSEWFCRDIDQRTVPFPITPSGIDPPDERISDTARNRLDGPTRRFRPATNTGREA